MTLVVVALLALTGCRAGSRPPDPSLAFDHDGYRLTCTDVERDACTGRADELPALFEGRNATIHAVQVSVRPDGRFTWCWERRPESALTAVLTGRASAGCTHKLDWTQPA